MPSLSQTAKAALASKAARQAAQQEAAQETLEKAATEAAHMAIEMLKNQAQAKGKTIIRKQEGSQAVSIPRSIFASRPIFLPHFL